jgi:hypothetical protein
MKLIQHQARTMLSGKQCPVNCRCAVNPSSYHFALRIATPTDGQGICELQLEQHAAEIVPILCELSPSIEVLAEFDAVYGSTLDMPAALHSEAFHNSMPNPDAINLNLAECTQKLIIGFLGQESDLCNSMTKDMPAQRCAE